MQIMESDMVRFFFIAALILVAFSEHATAESFRAVSTIDRMIEKEDPDGSIRLEFVKADRVIPGEDLFYQLIYDNASSETVEKASLVMNVPPEVIYSENSVVTDQKEIIVSYSADNGVSFSSREELKVTVEGKERQALSEDITNIRYAFRAPILPGEKGTVGFVAIVR